MKIKFSDKDIEQLYTKGFCDSYRGISNSSLDAFLKAFVMAENASCLEDVIKPPPYLGRQNKDGSISLFLKEGWFLTFTLKISDEENEVSVIGFSQILEEKL